MLQRIQTVFLALITIGMGVFVSFPVWEKFSADGQQSVRLNAIRFTKQLNATQSEVDSVLYLAVLGGIIGIVAAYAIFKYKNRVAQAGLCAVNSVMMTFLLGATIYQTWYKGGMLFDAQDTGNYLYGFYGLIMAMVANLAANRFIRRDERMVKESNRFR
jgi:glucan phosphoethanolaminetransferase (alkaline phosphatase superfamily)